MDGCSFEAAVAVAGRVTSIRRGCSSAQSVSATNKITPRCKSSLCEYGGYAVVVVVLIVVVVVVVVVSSSDSTDERQHKEQDERFFWIVVGGMFSVEYRYRR